MHKEYKSLLGSVTDYTRYRFQCNEHIILNMKAKRENTKLIDLNDVDTKSIESVCGFCKISI